MEAKHGADLSEAGKRISPEDGIAYTRKEFIEYFGGEVEWDAASPEDFDAAVFF
jgi:FAD/FMN-containing dehydrogenase|tara:strand:+ start:647 stop:808 length:162 start_codon:yes stop_codon:yes gene_type:complete